MELSKSYIRFHSTARCCVRVHQILRNEIDVRDYLIAAIESFHSQLMKHRDHHQHLITNGVVLVDLLFQGSRRTKQQSTIVLFHNEYDFEVSNSARLIRDGYTLKLVFLHFCIE